jgi:hypothetical protein
LFTEASIQALSTRDKSLSHFGTFSMSDDSER